MKTPPQVENVVVDEANQRTYVVMARRVLTDGELFSVIRVALLKREARQSGTDARYLINAPNV